jgi:hypothetical protein
MQQKKFCCRKSKRHLSSCQLKNPKKKKVPRKEQTTLPFISSGATEISNRLPAKAKCTHNPRPVNVQQCSRGAQAGGC